MEENLELNSNTNWNDILVLIDKNKFLSTYTNYSLTNRENGYLIESAKKEDHQTIFLLKKKKSIKIYFDDNNYQTINVITNLEIESYIKAKGKNIDDLFFQGEENKKYSDHIKSLGLCLMYYNLIIKEKKPLPALELKAPLSLDLDYTPKEYSKYFYEYFEYEEKIDENKMLIYDKNEMRNIITKNIAITLRDDDQIKTFKFTGPSSIGKSLTLLRLGHTCYNIAYINLKVLDKYKNQNDLNMIYSIIISELERFDIKNDLSSLNELINNNYKCNNSYFDLLLNIMNFLNKINQIFTFIFDQFKPKKINSGFIEAIEKINNIKIVICSSINNKDIRDECLKAWLLKGKKLMILDKNNQYYYFYFDKIYNTKKINNNSSDIFKYFDYMPKYINKYKKVYDRNTIFKDEKNYIVKKLEEFCDSNKLEKSLLFSNLRYIINKKFFYGEFEKIVQNCPLKYFIVNFYENDFMIRPIFPFMKYVINYELKELECFDYFYNQKYNNDIIKNKLVKGEYFEAAAKYALKNLEFPESKNYECLTVDEIVSMNKIIYNKDDYFIENELYNSEEIMENKENKNNIIINTEAIHDIIEKTNKINNNKKERNNVDDKEEKFEPYAVLKDFNDKYEDLDLDDNIIYQDNEEKMDFIVKENNDKKRNIKSKDEVLNTKLNNMLNKFGVKINNVFDERGLSEDMILFSKKLEDYRTDEIEEQKKKEQIFQENDFNGDLPIFLDQISKYGKALDFAYLYGKKDNKKFIGFQMKCYFQNSSLDDKFCKKYEIKKSCQKMLVNSMKILNCKITEWYYYLIFYFNPKNKNENINISNINKCEKNKIAYFFYDPVIKRFYNREENGKKNILRPIKKLTLNDKANLDKAVMDIDKFAFIFPQSFQKNMEDLQEAKNSFIKDLSKPLNILGEVNDINKILSEIETIINLKDYKLVFNGKHPFNNLLFAPKTDSYISLIKEKNEQKKKFVDFIAIILENNKPKLIEISTRKKLDKMYNHLDENADYYYSLFKIPKSKSNKRKNIDEKPNDIKQKGYKKMYEFEKK